MSKIILFAFIAMLFFSLGCGRDHGHNFFKPELADATYAIPQAGDPTADDARGVHEVRAEIELKPIKCFGADLMCIDIGAEGLYEGWQFVDDGSYYAAPALSRQ